MRTRILLALACLLFAPVALAQQVPQVQARSGKLAEGTRWETPWYEVDSGVEGPLLFITGGVHGNEPAGYRAAEQIRHWPITRGRMIVVPRVNRLGLAANTRWMPAYRNNNRLRDANRNFPRPGGPNEARTELCQALWTFVQQRKPDWVIDLHEGFDFNIANSRSVGSSLIYKRGTAMDKLAVKMQSAANATVDDPRRKFVLLNKSGPVSGSFARASIERLNCQGGILETTFKGQPLSHRVRQHRAMVSVLMRELSMIDQDCRFVFAPESRTDVRVVGLYDGPGTDDESAAALTRLFDADERFSVRVLGPVDLQSASLQQCDVLVFPGGSGSQQAKALGADCREKIRGYVRQGGGYLGIGAGAYLCSVQYDWSLKLIDTKVLSGSREVPGQGRKPMWDRGDAKPVKVELTPAGREVLGEHDGLLSITFHNGPIVSPAGQADLPTYRPLAYFRTEVAAWKPQEGTMVDTPAIVAGTFGSGRVISISPHAESSKDHAAIVVAAARWLSSRQEAKVPATGKTPAARK